MTPEEAKIAVQYLEQKKMLTPQEMTDYTLARFVLVYSLINTLTDRILALEARVEQETKN